MAAKVAACARSQGAVVEPSFPARENMPVHAEGVAGRGELPVRESEAACGVVLPIVPLPAKLPSFATVPLIASPTPLAVPFDPTFVQRAAKAVTPVTALP